MRTRQAFDGQLDELHESLFRIGTMVEAALGAAIEALQNHNDELALQVIKSDESINQAVNDLHDYIIHLIATQQPAARDLRRVSVALNLLPELERMGDHAATICKLQRRMAARPAYVPVEGLPEELRSVITEMSRRTFEILHAGLEALRARDRTFAERVVVMDDAIDHLYSQMFSATIHLVQHQPDLADEAVHLLTLTHNLERIGDRVTNVAEQIVYLTTGELVELNY